MNNKQEILRKKCVTVKEVQQEYLNMDIKKLRSFLNQYCSYKKIGNTYYYNRTEVEQLLLNEDSMEFPIE